MTTRLENMMDGGQDASPPSSVPGRTGARMQRLYLIAAAGISRASAFVDLTELFSDAKTPCLTRYGQRFKRSWPAIRRRWLSSRPARLNGRHGRRNESLDLLGGAKHEVGLDDEDLRSIARAKYFREWEKNFSASLGEEFREDMKKPCCRRNRPLRSWHGL